MSRSSSCRQTAVALLILGAGFATVRAGDVAQVPETLKSDPAYASYAKIMVQLDLLSNPLTAGLPVTIDSPIPGVLEIRGSVPNPKLKETVVRTALRISGLNVREVLRVVPAPPEKDGANDLKERPNLEKASRETIQTLFPELAGQMKAASSRDGVVVLTGTAPCFEARLLTSQAIKSQPGCRAVVNMLQVPAHSETQKLTVTEDGRETLFAAQLPAIPESASTEAVAEHDPILERPAIGIGAADDAPPVNQADQQIQDEIRARFDRDGELARLKVEIAVEGGVVTLSGNVFNRQQVELAVATASEAPMVAKVIAKCRPYSIQRFRPQSYDASKGKTERLNKTTQPRKLFGLIPLGGSEPAPGAAPVGNRYYRDAIKKTLMRRCGTDVEDLLVKASPDNKGLLIEGKVATPQKRLAVFKQIDNLAELRNLNYDIVLQIKEGE